MRRALQRAWLSECCCLYVTAVRCACGAPVCAGGWVKLRNVSLCRLPGSELQLVFTVKSKVQEANPALVRQLEDNIGQRAAAVPTASPPAQQFSSCTLNMLPALPFTPLRCVGGGCTSAAKYRVLCRAVAVWPTDFRQWTHLCCLRCGDRTECSSIAGMQAGGSSGGNSSSGSSSSGCRACGALDSRRCEWGFSLILEDATALLQAEVWGAQAVGNISHTHTFERTSPRR